jgi:hypothetical protein
MAQLGGTVDEQRVVKADVETTRAHFADLAVIRAATIDAESITDLGGGVLAFVMPEQQHGPVRFRPEFQVRYWLDGGTLRWEPSGSGNMSSRGQATFEVDGAGGTRIKYHQEIGFDLPVNGLVARMLAPVVGQMIAPGVRAYLDRMVAGLAGR